jgi:hypothetical protein
VGFPLLNFSGLVGPAHPVTIGMVASDSAWKPGLVREKEPKERGMSRDQVR